MYMHAGFDTLNCGINCKHTHGSCCVSLSPTLSSEEVEATNAFASDDEHVHLKQQTHSSQATNALVFYLVSD